MSVFKGAFHHDHVTDGSKCWCKNRVNVMLDGVKVGTGEVNVLGMMTMTITSDELAKKMAGDTSRLQHISIDAQLKE